MVAALLASAVASAGVGAQAREVDVNGLYPAGTRLVSPTTGIAFQLPAGFRAEWDAALGALMALSADGAFGVVWGWSEGSVEDAAGEVGSRLDEQGVALQVRGEPEVTATELRAAFDATTAEGRGILHALIRQGELGGVVVIAGMGVPASEASALRFVDDVAASLEWTEPGAAVMRGRVVGSVLTTSAEGSDLGAGASTATGPSPTSATLSFCGPEAYVYRETSDVSIVGASASTTSSEEHAGVWWLISDLSGMPLLVLETTDGRTFQWPVEASGDGFLIDGSLYRPTGTC